MLCCCLDLFDVLVLMLIGCVDLGGVCLTNVFLAVYLLAGVCLV